MVAYVAVQPVLHKAADNKQSKQLGGLQNIHKVNITLMYIRYIMYVKWLGLTRICCTLLLKKKSESNIAILHACTNLWEWILRPTTLLLLCTVRSGTLLENPTTLVRRHTVPTCDEATCDEATCDEATCDEEATCLWKDSLCATYPGIGLEKPSPGGYVGWELTIMKNKKTKTIYYTDSHFCRIKDWACWMLGGLPNAKKTTGTCMACMCT